MLLGFYSTLIIFLLIFLVTSVYILVVLKRRRLTIGKSFILSVLLILSVTITYIYGSDYIQLKRGNTEITNGVCQVEYVRGGKSVDTTEITIKDKQYNIKSDIYKDLPDGIYRCEIRYLPLTKIVFESDIEY